ncbi:MAG TPA: hypothetical protein VF032_15810 [Thermoleophilaceae bacterium]
MSTRSEQRNTARERPPIFVSVGRRRRSLAAISILALTAVTLVAVLVVILANA